MPETPSRRLLLTGALTGGLVALTGCGVRLEDDAPRIPFVPTREPMPGESALLAVLGTLDASDEEQAGERADLLREALREARVPEDLLTAPSAPSAPGEQVAAFEAAVRDCGAALLPLVGRMTATHRIAMDAEELWTATDDPHPWTVGEAAADAQQATLAATYALDLVAARATDERASAEVLDISRSLGDLAVRQKSAAGESVEPSPLGYEVPHELTTQEGIDLGTRCVERLLAAYAATFSRLGEDRDAALEVTAWMATAERVSRDRFPLEVPVLYGDEPTDS